SAQRLRAPGSAQVTTGYFGDLAATSEMRLTATHIGGRPPPVHLVCSCCCGGHVRIGPPSGAGTCGTAAATYVPTSPNIRIEILTACFIGLLSFSALGALKIGHRAAERNYTARVKPFCKKSFTTIWYRLCEGEAYSSSKKVATLVNTGDSVVVVRYLP